MWPFKKKTKVYDSRGEMVPAVCMNCGEEEPEVYRHRTMNFSGPHEHINYYQCHSCYTIVRRSNISGYDSPYDGKHIQKVIFKRGENINGPREDEYVE